VAWANLRPVVDLVGVDQDLADVGLEVVADGADDERGFLVDQNAPLAGSSAPSMARHSCIR
jgi:hypothetical protein